VSLSLLSAVPPAWDGRVIMPFHLEETCISHTAEPRPPIVTIDFWHGYVMLG
jgi:hypothetical protein